MFTKLKCFLGFHIWDERAESVKCVRAGCKYHEVGIGWDDQRIKKIHYRRNSNRPYKGK